VWLALGSSGSDREYFESSNCDLCNETGCVDENYTRDDCPEIDIRATALRWETHSPSPTRSRSRSYSRSRSPSCTRSPSMTPLPSVTPASCGVPGVYVSKHTSYGQETWVQSSRAFVEADNSEDYQFLSIKGSYLSGRTGSYSWLLNHPVGYYFWLDGSLVSFSSIWGYEDGQYIDEREVYLYSGYRYSFYVTTYDSYYSHGYIWLALYNSASGREYLGSSNCDLCNVSGCIDLDYVRGYCPEVTPHATPVLWETRTPRPTPSPRATPQSCGIPGVMISKHADFLDEDWSLSDYATVTIAINEVKYVSIKGSYVCTESGNYRWGISPGFFDNNWILSFDGNWSSSFDYNGESYFLPVHLESGYRYPFYFYTTTMETGTSVSLYLQDTYGNFGIINNTKT
jgi:hypothetical protein